MHHYIHMEKSPSLHELFNLKLFKFFYLNLFHIMATILFSFLKPYPRMDPCCFLCFLHLGGNPLTGALCSI